MRSLKEKQLEVVYLMDREEYPIFIFKKDIMVDFSDCKRKLIIRNIHWWNQYSIKCYR